MPYYIINKNKDSGGRNEVHTTVCAHRPYPENSLSLGYHANELDAVRYAKNAGWSAADGCYYCCPKAHRG